MRDEGTWSRHDIGDLTGQTAVVTGASTGIGFATARALAAHGARVVLACRDMDRGRLAAQRMTSAGTRPGVEVEALDLADLASVRRFAGRLLQRPAGLDILVNNAGITRDRSMRKMTEDDWAQVINVNLNGTFYCTSAALPAMINQRYGRIINISSVVGQMGAFGQANYSASKGGIIAFTKTLALEMAKFNITANSIAPGFTSTEMVDAIPEEIAAQIKAKIPLGRFATPEEIAKAAAFLATDGDYITGQELNINGGYHM